MIEAKIQKIAIMPEKGTSYLYAVAAYGTEMLNLRVPFDLTDVDYRLFLQELRDKIAEEFDIPVYHVDLDESVIVGKMTMWSERFKSMGLI